jgi:hypothetical protein
LASIASRGALRPAELCNAQAFFAHVLLHEVAALPVNLRWAGAARVAFLRVLDFDGFRAHGAQTTRDGWACEEVAVGADAKACERQGLRIFHGFVCQTLLQTNRILREQLLNM